MIVLRCPSCNEPVGEVEGEGRARLRCKSRHCRDKPRVLWQFSDAGAVKVSMDVDRRRPVAVS